MECKHNQRSRYTDGFFCDNCQTFFSKESPTYRKDEYLSRLWMVLNNINVDLFRAGKEKLKDVSDIKEEIGIGLVHDNFEDIITRAEAIIKKYNSTPDSATVLLKSQKSP